MTDSISFFQEQSQQYACTIVALEERLLKRMEECKIVEDENHNLKELVERARTSNVSEVDGTEWQLLWGGLVIVLYVRV